MISALDSMPVLTASVPMSASTASTCDSITDVGSSSTSVTSSVFCAVIAVTTEVPYTPSAAKVLRSAWMPAPAPESEPAIVIALGTFANVPLLDPIGPLISHAGRT